MSLLFFLVVYPKMCRLALWAEARQFVEETVSAVDMRLVAVIVRRLHLVARFQARLRLDEDMPPEATAIAARSEVTATVLAPDLADAPDHRVSLHARGVHRGLEVVHHTVAV
jgi:sensor domain CHASE-containing protein